MSLEYKDSLVVEAGFDDEIARLEAELEAAVELRDTLVEEFQNLAPAVQEAQGSGILALPNELLADILADALRESTTTRLQLQLVSRKWNELVLHTPMLWSSFRVIVPADYRAIESCSAYWERCIRRSSGCPMDISIRYLRPPQLMVELRKCLGTTTLPISPSIDRVVKFLLYGKQMYRMLSRYLECIYLRPITLFTKHPGSMERWRSFELRATHGRGGSCFDKAIRQGLFGGDTPMLERLTLWAVDQGRQLWSLYDAILLSEKCKNPFPHLPAIKELYLHDIRIPFTVENPEQVDQLDTLCLTIDDFVHVMAYRNVTYLRVGIHTIRGSDLNLLSTQATFPQLQRLHLLQRIPNWFYGSLDTPKLEVIVFEDFTPMLTLREFSLQLSVKRMEFRWTYTPNAEYYFMKIVLPILLTNFTALETILISRPFATHLMAQLEPALETGVGSGTFKSLLVVDQPMSEEVVEVIHL
ncbi:hypothetical protein FRC17_000477 [Serendipita sp. 399]|nr:hypothetical protein FRC17_000477 [Serendipita sp. 399]